MSTLILGVLLWGAVHLFPSALPNQRQSLLTKWGEQSYKGRFLLLIIISIALMVFGWRSATPVDWYTPASGLMALVMPLMILTFILFGVSAAKTSRVSQYVRHPQLYSVVIFSIAHLLCNGDSRSVVLFGGLLVWALAAIFFINRRDGEWIKPTEVSSWPKEGMTLVISLVVYAIVALVLHQYISGVALG